MTRPLPTLSRTTVRILDRLTIDVLGIPGLLLMENAGQGCADLLCRELDTGAWHDPVLVIAGQGNNGGDGFVIARHLVNRGHQAQVLLVGHASRFRPGSDARVNLDALGPTGVPIQEIDGPTDTFRAALARAGCVVDAVFGTGLDRPVRDPFTALFQALNAAERPVLAVDVPSGLDAERGVVLGAAIKAARTATFAAAKPGLWDGDGPAYAGNVAVVPISIPGHLIEAALRDEKAFMAHAERELASSSKK